MVSKNLTEEQTQTRADVCIDTLEAIENDDPETKCQSMSTNSPRVKKVRMSKSKFKAMIIVFFDIYSIVYIHWVPKGQTVNQHYYL